MTAPAHIANAARERVRQSLDRIRQSMRAIAEGRPGDAEPEVSRRAAVLQHRAAITYEDATRLAPASGGEKVWGKTIDFVDYVFLERGMRAGRAVARVATRDGQGIGTGFMISPCLFITNNHVLPDRGTAQAFVVEFDYERDARGAQKPVTRFAMAPSLCFLTNHEDNLDYTVVALGERLSGAGDARGYGYLPISGARDKHALGDHVNLIQHPDARLKEAVLRENQLVARAKTALHYVADTEPGSSGSPVFNVLWDVVALHHWGGPHRDLVDEAGKPLAKTVNEGIRISAIVGDLNTRKTGLNGQEREMVNEALTIGLDPEAHRPTGSPTAPPQQGADLAAVEVSRD
jgi:endonuclease G, mitochondrial